MAADAEDLRDGKQAVDDTGECVFGDVRAVLSANDRDGLSLYLDTDALGTDSDMVALLL